MSTQQVIGYARTSFDEIKWHEICPIDYVVPGTGVAALVQGEQIAIIRTMDGLFAALSNYDPFSQAYVIARGIVGDRAGVPKIASPIYKQSFSLETGECLDDPNVHLAVYPIRVFAGKIQVALPRASASCAMATR